MRGRRLVMAAMGAAALAVVLSSCGQEATRDIHITSQPRDTSCIAGESASFSVHGDNVGQVQWQVSTDHGATYHDISGANAVTYTRTCTEADNGTMYRAVLTNGSAPTELTFAAHLTVSAPSSTTGGTPTGSGSTATPAAPKFTVQPTSNLTHCSVGQQILVSADASGFPPPKYQWQQSSSPNGPFTDVVGASAMNYSFQCQSTIYMRVIVSNSQGTAASQVIPINVS